MNAAEKRNRKKIKKNNKKVLKHLISKGFLCGGCGSCCCGGSVVGNRDKS
jgi:coenzyme F420-reducing hydrogenase gamma subunit